MAPGNWRAIVMAAPLLALVLGVPQGTLASADATDREPRLAVTVEVDDPPLTIHERSGPLLPRVDSDEARLAGLAFLELTMRTEYDMILVSYSSGENLFWVSGIHLTLAYRNPKVFISGRYHKGGCEFRAVLGHEEQHVRADRTVVRTYGEKMRAALESAAWPTYKHPRQVTSLDEGKLEIRAQLAALVQPLFEEMKERRREVRETLDSPESYRRTHQQCASH